MSASPAGRRLCLQHAAAVNEAWSGLCNQLCICPSALTHHRVSGHVDDEFGAGETR